MLNSGFVDCAMRIKNYKENKRVSGLVNKFEKIDSLCDISTFAKAVELVKEDSKGKAIQIKCVGKEALYYGHLNNLLEYAGGLKYKPVEMPLIEHGINFDESPISSDLIHASTSFIFQGPYKQKTIHAMQPNKSVFCIGPYIYYAKDYYSKEQFSKVKSQWGRTAVLFPFHTFEANSTERKLSGVINQFYDKYHADYDKLVVCLYWLDIDDHIIDLFEKFGIAVVSSGARFDPNFLRRQKAILDLADIVVGDDIGSYIGYALCEEKEIDLLFDEDTLLKRKKLLQGYRDEYFINQRKIFKAFSEHNNSDIEDIYRYFWGGKECLKKPEEIKFILDYSDRIYKSSFGFEGKFGSTADKIMLENSEYSYLLFESIRGK